MAQQGLSILKLQNSKFYFYIGAIMDENNEDGFLYVMENDESLNLKIGVSRFEPRGKRLKQLNSGTKNDGEIRCIKTIRTPDYKNAERILHKLYQRFRVRGEWFRIPTEERVLLLLLTPSKVIKMIDKWNQSPISSLKPVFGGEGMFYENRIEYLDKVHKENEEKIVSLNREVLEIKKQKQELETQIAAIKFYSTMRETPTASIVRAALTTIPPLRVNSAQDSDENE